MCNSGRGQVISSQVCVISDYDGFLVLRPSDLSCQELWLSGVLVI